MPYEPGDAVNGSDERVIDRRALFDAISRFSFARGLRLRALPGRWRRPHGYEERGTGEFQADIESGKGWVGSGGSPKEATVAELPVSQSIADVSMRFEPGAIRELHWHALAAEWAYVPAGRCRTTVITPNGQADVDDFEGGDTWYFPRGHGHAIRALGPGECHLLLGFDNGHFSEFGAFSIVGPIWPLISS